ncbi:MAG: MBL fold metallo-hydrolase [Beijerinckiaceae bacterium]
MTQFDITRRQGLIAAASATASLFWTQVALAAGEEFKTLSDGVRNLPTGILSSSANGDQIKKALADSGLATDVSRSPSNVSMLIRGDDLILFDCGAGPNFMQGVGTLPDSLNEAGIAPERVKHVLFTHAHPDHLWGALDDFGSPAFPNATYHMASAERDFWFSPDVYKILPEDRHSFAAGAQRILKELDSVMKWFKPGDEVAPGVSAFSSRGHTPGHVSFDVRVGNETVCVVGDALTHGVISFQYPDWSGGFDQEPEQAIASRKQLLDRFSAQKVRIVGYHLPAGGIGRVERAGSAYRFVQNG